MAFRLAKNVDGIRSPPWHGHARATADLIDLVGIGTIVIFLLAERIVTKEPMVHVPRDRSPPTLNLVALKTQKENELHHNGSTEQVMATPLTGVFRGTDLFRQDLATSVVEVCEGVKFGGV